MAKRVLVCSNYAWTLVNFRLSLLRALVAHSYEVHVLTQFDGTEGRLRDAGAIPHELLIDSQGINPLREAQTFINILRTLRTLRPLCMLNFTIKPVTYGGLAARLLGTPCINTITGLGTVFTREGWLTKVVEVLYRLSQRRAKRVFFQNDDDRQLFHERRLVANAPMERLPGSGVDLKHFQFQPLPTGEEIRFLLIARMLWDKGVGEFVAAARRVRVAHPQARFQLLGPIGVANRSAIPREQIESWSAEGVVDYLGAAVDVRPYISRAHCIVLPSIYREGVPRALLEAAAMGRPIITTDSVGCREVVDNAVSGFLSRPRDVDDLADKVSRILSVPRDDLEAMGRSGRAKIEREFDEAIVIRRYLDVLAEITAGP